MLIEVYADGSSDGKSGGKCGYGFVICVNGIKIAEGSDSIQQGTNNTSEVIGALRGLEYIATTDLPGIDAGADNADDARNARENGVRVVLVSDSLLTLNWASGNYRCKKWHLIPHVIKLRKLFQKLNAETRWVKGHSGQEFNERCDELAKAARETSSNQLQQNKDPHCP